MFPRLLIATVLGLVIVDHAGLDLPLSTQAPAQPVFSTRSALVVLHVMVTDKKGAYVGDLPSEAFTVFDDDQRQTVPFFAPQDTPVTAGLLVDSSGSMLSARDRVVTAAGTFAETSNSQDEMFALTFNERVRAARPPDSPFTADADTLRMDLDRVISARGRTALYDAISAGIEYSNKGSRPRKVLVVVSDGADNASAMTFDQVLKKTEASNVAIYTIALIDPAPVDSDADPKHLRRLAEVSGGKAFEPQSISDVSDVMRHIARDIRNTYTIGYVLANTARDGRFHRIRVVVNTPERRSLVVRTRAGYIAEERSPDAR